MLQLVITDVTQVPGGPLQVTVAHQLFLRQAVLTWAGAGDPVFLQHLYRQARLQSALRVADGFFDLPERRQRAAVLGALRLALSQQAAPKPWGRFPN